MSPRPVFLARGRYRQRRLRDGLRMLPVLGAVLWMVPVMWPRGQAAGQGNAGALVYVFGVWALLVILGAVMAGRLRPDGDGVDGDG